MSTVVAESPIVLRSPQEYLPHQCSICRKRIAAYTVAALRLALQRRRFGGLRPAFVPVRSSFQKFDAAAVAPFIENLRARIALGEHEQVWS